ncbi:MAG: hypothetical protein NZ874_03595 [Fimbriimonadales bacterium]|nr:hypothetical protein [Fimbriimonadales bacterium]
MIGANRLLGLVLVAALTSAAYSQTLADRLRQAGSISFKINNASYSIDVGVESCTTTFASGTTGAQNTLVINFLPNSLDFEVTLNQVINAIASQQPVRFNATVSNNGTRITWTAQNIPAPVCTIITINNTGYPFKIYNVFGTITVDLQPIPCQSDPLGVLGRNVNIRLNLDPSSQVGFTGRVADQACFAEFLLACARAFNLDFEGYGGRCAAGDVDGNGCVNDQDLLTILLNFGGSGSGDVDGNGTVNDQDLLIVLLNFGQGC